MQSLVVAVNFDDLDLDSSRDELLSSWTEQRAGGEIIEEASLARQEITYFRRIHIIGTQEDHAAGSEHGLGRKKWAKKTKSMSSTSTYAILIKLKESNCTVS